MSDAAKPGVTFGDPNAGRDASDSPIDAAKDGNKDTKAPLEGESNDEAKNTTTIDKDFVFMHRLDPARQIPGTNKYLDVEQRKAAEIDRAAVEGREPDLENPPASQGTPYRSAEQLAAELPPHATVKADVTLPVVVTEDDAADAQKREDRAKELQTKTVFDDPAKAQERQPQDAEGNKDLEGSDI